MLKISNLLKSIDGVIVKQNVDLSTYSTIKTKSFANIVIVSDINALKKVIKAFNTEGCGYTLLGLGANQVLKGAKDKFYIKLKFLEAEDIKSLKDSYTVSASLSLNKLTSLAMKYNLDGWQCLTGIPATVGGAIAMNAGTRIGEIAQIVKEVVILRKSGDIETHKVNKDSFVYRNNKFLNPGDIIIEAKLIHFGQKDGVKEQIKDYLTKRKEDQPWGTQNCGCVFKNNPNLSAGAAIDAIGLKGFYYKGLKISEVHANFIENNGATYEDFIQFTKFINHQLESFCGQKFELEVKID